MISTKALVAVATGALIVGSPAAFAQTGSTQQSPDAQENRVGNILRSLFGDRLGVSTSVEQQWTLGRKPLATQKTQFDTRIDADVRSRALTAANGARMKTEYNRLVALETRYGADGRFTTQERTELADGYGALTQALTEGGFADSGTSAKLAVADGRVDFERRVDASVSSRRLSRVEATRLKRDYADLVQTEATYARDGISSREQDDLEARLDGLDQRVGDTAYGNAPTVVDNRTRLTNIERALASSGLATAVQTQLRVELGDLTRLEAAYSRMPPSNDDKSYLERRIADLETRARVRR